MAFGIFWTKEVIFNVILIIRFRFEFQLQDDRHLEIIFRFDLFHARASVILTGILFKWINTGNGDDNDFTSSSSRTTTIITTTKVRNY